MAGMDFRGAKRRAREILAPTPRPQDLQASTLRRDKLRDNIIRDAEEHTERFQSAVRRVPKVAYEHTNEDGTKEQREHTWQGYGECVRDVARALFGIDEPEMTDRRKVRPESQLSWDVIRMMLGQEAFLESRPYARMNEAEAIAGAMAVGDILRDLASSVLAEHVARSEEARQDSEAAQSADDLMQRLRDRAKQEIDASGEVQAATKRALKNAYKQQQQALANLAQTLQQMQASGQAVAAAQAAKAAASAAQDAIESVEAIKGITEGNERQLDPQTQLELANRLKANPFLAKVLREIGRLYRDMRYKRETRTRSVPTEPVDITLGRDAERLLPMEMARAQSPMLRPLFALDFVEGRLMQYEMSGRMPAGKGAGIFVIDQSGSMWEERYMYAAAVGAAVLLVMRKEKRTAAIVHFGWHRELKSWVFPANEDLDPEVFLEVIGHFYGGGTDIPLGLGEAKRILESEPAFKTADVVLVGDGGDTWGDSSTKLRDWFRANNVRTHGISILARNNRYFAEMCSEGVVDVVDLANYDTAIDALAENMS
jgi:uncharacterized protein with von Willebrand factor type A (vWA) domain